MSNSDDKKGSGSGDQKSPRSKPAKRTRNRKASRPPTIDVEAVRLEAEKTEKSKPEVAAKASEKTETKTKADINRPSPDINMFTDGSGNFTYRDMALSASVGAAVTFVLFAVIFGISFFSSGQNDMENRISALSDKVAGLSTAVKNTSASQDAIEILKRQVEKLNNRPEVSKLAKISERIKAIETTIANPQKPAVDATEIKGLVEKVAALDEKTAQAISTAEKSIRRAGILEQAIKVADEAIKGSTDGTQGSLVAQNLRLAGLEKNITDLRKDVDDLTSQISTLNEFAGEVSATQTSSAAVTSSIDARLTKLEEEDRSDSTGRLAALSFAIENLAQKIKSGDVFKTELKIVSAALPDNAQLDKLNDQANSGVKSIAQLQREFTSVLRAVLAAEDTEVASGVMGKLVGTAKSLIKIRRVGEVEGESREAIIARLEIRVKAGKLDAGLVEAKKLKGASARAIAGWVQSVEERMQTIKLINNLRNDVISGNAKSATKE